MRFRDFVKLPLIQVVAIDRGDGPMFLDEGKWIDGRYDRNIRIDRDTHFSDADASGRHAHVYGRNDRTGALIAVRQTGGVSHNLPGRLHKADADALRAQGFAVPASGLVECVELPEDPDVVMLLDHLG